MDKSSSRHQLGLCTVAVFVSATLVGCATPQPRADAGTSAMEFALKYAEPGFKVPGSGVVKDGGVGCFFKDTLNELMRAVEANNARLIGALVVQGECAQVGGMQFVVLDIDGYDDISYLRLYKGAATMKLWVPNSMIGEWVTR